MKYQYLIFTSLLLASCGQIKLNLNQKVKAPAKKVPAYEAVWIKNLDPNYNSGNLPIGTSSPFIFQDIVYMGDLTGNMTAYSLEDGHILWQKNERKPIQAPVNKVGDYIYYGSKTGRLFVRHYLTGELKYAVDLGAPIESRAVYTAGRIFIHMRNHTLISLDAKTGKVFWRYQRSIPYTTTLQRVSEALEYEGNLFIGFADGHLVSLSLEEGVVNWEQKISTGVKFVDVDVNPFVFGKYIVAGSAAGPMRFINPRNGLVEKTIELRQSHTPIIEGEDLIVGSTEGKIYRINSYGKILEQRQITENGISSITQWKNGFAVTTMGAEIYYLSRADFTVLGEFSLGTSYSAIFGHAVKSDKYLSVYSSRNRLYVFQ